MNLFEIILLFKMETSCTQYRWMDAKVWPILSIYIVYWQGKINELHQLSFADFFSRPLESRMQFKNTHEETQNSYPIKTSIFLLTRIINS